MLWSWFVLGHWFPWVIIISCKRWEGLLRVCFACRVHILYAMSCPSVEMGLSCYFCGFLGSPCELLIFFAFEIVCPFWLTNKSSSDKDDPSLSEWTAHVSRGCLHRHGFIRHSIFHQLLTPMRAPYRDRPKAPKASGPAIARIGIHFAAIFSVLSRSRPSFGALLDESCSLMGGHKNLLMCTGSTEYGCFCSCLCNVRSCDLTWMKGGTCLRRSLATWFACFP